MFARALISKLYRRTVERLSRHALRAVAWDIEMGAQLRALASTCAYVEERLPRCAALTSVREVLDFAVRRCPADGFVCEFGVFSGNSINHLARKLRPRLVHGFDSFEGLPESWRTGFDKGMFSTRVPEVEANVLLHKGWFEDTLPDFVKSLDPQRASLLHIDCDLYSSTRTIFEHLAPFIVAGTVVVFDEYFNYPGWQGHEHKALQEFCGTSGKTYDYLAYNRLHEQVVIQFH